MGTTTAQVQALDVTTKQLSDGNGLEGGGGTLLGINSSDLIGFYGKTPISQPAGPGQAAITRGLASGVLATIKATSLTPTTVAANTTAEYTFTAVVSTASASGFQVATGDVLYVNKPTSQAGLGIGNVRIASTNSIGLTFSNYTSGTLTPSAQSYGFIAIRGVTSISATLTPAAVAPNSTVEQQFTVSGLRGSLVQVIKPTAQAGIDIVGCRAIPLTNAQGVLTGENGLGITFTNATAATVTPTAGESYTILECAGLDADNNMLGINYLSSGATTVASTTTAEQGWTVTGLTTTDMVVGLSKPTFTTGLGVVGWRVSTTSTLGITFVNQTTTNTPPTTDVYSIFIYRPNPAAPLVVYTSTLTPVSVAANTTAEQTFTVTGLVANSLVWVNNTNPQAGLGIVGVRVSAVNTLAITYGNSSAATITPTAGTYLIGNFQLPLGDAGSTWIQTVNQSDLSQSILANSERSALVSLGLMAGA
jgi:hypothetical protein